MSTVRNLCIDGRQVPLASVGITLFGTENKDNWLVRASATHSPLAPGHATRVPCKAACNVASDRSLAQSEDLVAGLGRGTDEAVL